MSQENYFDLASESANGMISSKRLRQIVPRTTGRVMIIEPRTSDNLQRMPGKLQQ